jgi:replicative DNA helicase
MNVTQLAEQATLGALLLEPLAMDAMAKWLRAGDFAQPWHQVVYTAIQERHAARSVIDAQTVGTDLVERFGYRRADLPRVVDLLQAAPVRPAAAVYGAMVLEASLRREVAGQGVLLRAAALQASLARESRPINTVTAMVDAAFDSAEDRWSVATGHGKTAPPEPAPVPTPIRAALRNPHTAVAADRLLSANPPLHAAVAEENEALLVASLVTHPGRIAATASWLPPEALTNCTWRPVYWALVQLADLGQHIDLITVAWEVRRTSPRLGAGPGLRELRRAVEGAVADDPVYLGRIVAGDRLRRIADRAADGLHTSAANPGIDVRDLLNSGRLATAALRHAAVALPEDAGDTSARYLGPVRDLVPPVPATAAGEHGPVAG